MEMTIAETRGADIHCLFRADAAPHRQVRVGKAASGQRGEPRTTSRRAIEPGIYAGQWKDGQTLTEVIRSLSKTTISMASLGSDGIPVPYKLIGNDTYRNYSGSRIVVHSKDVLVWMNADGGNPVTFRRQV